MENTIETTVAYKGNDYKAIKYEDSGITRVLAFEKLRMLKDHHKPYSILTSYESNNVYVVAKATLTIHGEVFNGTRAVAFKEAKEDAYALAETFAISRAASLFLGLEVEIASVEEVSSEIVVNSKDITSNLKDAMKKTVPVPPVEEEKPPHRRGVLSIPTAKEEPVQRPTLPTMATEPAPTVCELAPTETKAEPIEQPIPPSVDGKPSPPIQELSNTISKDWTEQTLISLKTGDDIHNILKQMGIDPSLLPQKNTNAKMRGLILANQFDNLKNHIVATWGEDVYEFYQEGGDKIETTIKPNEKLEEKANEILKEVSDKTIIDFTIDNIPPLNKQGNRTGVDDSELNALWEQLDQAFKSDEAVFAKYVEKYGLEFKTFEEFVLHATAEQFELLFTT